MTGSIVLFQGDSITDCGRDRSIPAANDARALGTGYPLLLTGALRDRYPERDLQVVQSRRERQHGRRPARTMDR